MRFPVKFCVLFLFPRAISAVALVLRSQITALTKKVNTCEISGSHGGEYEMTVFLDDVTCSLVETDCRFRGAHYLHHKLMCGSKHL
jgi:hypothetical protein